MLVAAPVRFSTTNGWPSRSESHSPITRAVVSALPPAAKPTWLVSGMQDQVEHEHRHRARGSGSEGQPPGRLRLANRRVKLIAALAPPAAFAAKAATTPAMGLGGAYAIRALPGLCVGITLECLERCSGPSRRILHSPLLEAPARPGLSFALGPWGWRVRTFAPAQDRLCAIKKEEPRRWSL